VEGWSETEVARHALAVLPVRSGPGLEPLSVTPARYPIKEARYPIKDTRLLTNPSSCPILHT
jgi:hypothetical protein